MTDRSKTPSLGGRRKVRSGMEPGLSKDHRPNRAETVRPLLEDLHNPVLHTRFRAVLALGSYADHEHAVAAVIRTLHDDSVLVRLAAIFVLGQIGPRLINPLLRVNAVEGLGRFLTDDVTLTIPALAIEMLLQMGQTWSESITAKALIGTLAALPDRAEGRVASLSEFAAQSLTNIGAPDGLTLVDWWRRQTAEI